MAHAQKPDFVFRRNGRVHLNWRGRHFSWLLAAEVCASAVVMLDTPCSEVVWRVLATHSIRQFPLHLPSLRHRVPSHFNQTTITSVTFFGWWHSEQILSGSRLCTRLIPGLQKIVWEHEATFKANGRLHRHNFVYLLNYSMVQSPSWEANWFAASQQIPRISRNPKVHYRTHKRPPPVSILGQANPVHIPTSHLLEIHHNIIRPPTPRSPQWSLSLRFTHQDPIHPPLLTHTRHMPSTLFTGVITRQSNHV